MLFDSNIDQSNELETSWNSNDNSTHSQTTQRSSLSPRRISTRSATTSTTKQQISSNTSHSTAKLQTSKPLLLPSVLKKKINLRRNRATSRLNVKQITVKKKIF